MLARRRRSLAVLGSVAMLLASACFGSGDDEVEVIVDGVPLTPVAATPLPTAAPTLAPLPFTPTPPPAELDPSDVHGFTFPFEGGCLPSNPRVMPNAPREYRNGFHEGVDFYNGDVCVPVDRGIPLVVMFDGVVVRADHDYVDITPQQVVDLAAKTARQGFSDAETLDTYRGRQVWIDHGGGVVTRYAHMDTIDASLFVGKEVRAGDPVGTVGESGTPESVTAPGTEYHLHLEVRVGDSFLGAGLSPDVVRALYERVFAIDEVDEVDDAAGDSSTDASGG
jgi:murein DD-endopeptidase MepM/ murein hydrolase activator NlpD